MNEYISTLGKEILKQKDIWDAVEVIHLYVDEQPDEVKDYLIELINKEIAKVLDCNEILFQS